MKQSFRLIANRHTAALDKRPECVFATIKMDISFKLNQRVVNKWTTSYVTKMIDIFISPLARRQGAFAVAEVQPR